MGINRQPRRVPKSASESQQVNRQRRNSGSIASSSIASSQRPVLKVMSNPLKIFEKNFQKFYFERTSSKPILVKALAKMKLW